MYGKKFKMRNGGDKLVVASKLADSRLGKAISISNKRAKKIR